MFSCTLAWECFTQLLALGCFKPFQCTQTCNLSPDALGLIIVYNWLLCYHLGWLIRHREWNRCCSVECQHYTQLPRPVPGLGHKGNRIPGQTPKPWWSFRILTQHTLPMHWTHLPQRRKSLTPFPMSDHWQHSGSIPPCPSRSISWQVEKKAWCTLPLHGEEFKPCGSWAVCTGPSPWY